MEGRGILRGNEATRKNMGVFFGVVSPRGVQLNTLGYVLKLKGSLEFIQT